jgi:protein-L-isoaspartate(D-aspartate) O-methyltransferase
MADLALQRKNMVESQVRPSDVTDRRIMAAMTNIARERYVPPNLLTLAYTDEAVPLSGGRALMAPRTLARLIQLAGAEMGDKALVVGAATGYGAAVLGHLGCHVVALECDALLAKAAQTALINEALEHVTVVTGALTEGHAAGAPYDVILVEGAVELIPPGLLSQLAAGGRLVTIVIADGVGRAVVVSKAEGGVPSQRAAFDAEAASLPGFERPRGFTF